MPTPIPFLHAPGAPAAQCWLQALRAAMPGERVLPLAALDEQERAACELAVVANPRPEDLRLLPNLKWVQSVWAGVERLVPALAGSPVRLVRLLDPQLAHTMAEAVLAWTLYLHRDMPRYARQQAARQWLAHEGVRAQARTVSLLGLGALGAASARCLQQAGFQVRGWSRSPKSLPGVQCHSGSEGLHEMLAATDILVCLLPLTPDTHGLLDADRLRRLRPQAALINFARGPIVQDQALRQALDEQHLSHAVLDVFAEEPLPADAWHWAHPQVTVLPHISAPTDRNSAAGIVAANVARYRQSGSVPQTVDLARGY